jgi:hypothetical protein
VAAKASPPNWTNRELRFAVDTAVAATAVMKSLSVHEI